MVIGIGTDIVDVLRLSKSIDNQSFVFKVFSSLEISYCESKRNRAQHYAARFAAKEAFVKALGTGFVSGMSFREVEVRNDDSGKPTLNIVGATAELPILKTIGNIHLTLSHVEKYATATVLLESL